MAGPVAAGDRLHAVQDPATEQEASGLSGRGGVHAGVPSNSILRWRGPAQADLNDIVEAHASVAGIQRGRRAATAQVTQAYAVLLSSHFQRFCRDLHTEAVDQVVGALADPWVRPIVTNRLSEGRKLDTGNPTPGHIGSDFNRLQFSLWATMTQLDARTPGRRVRLERLNRWRNAIAHQDFAAKRELDLGGGRTDLRLGDVTDWRDREGGTAENYELKIGSGQVIPGFEGQMIGMNVEDAKDVKVTFPADYHEKALAGKEAVFAVKLHEIKQRLIPALTDDFVKDFVYISPVAAEWLAARQVKTIGADYLSVGGYKAGGALINIGVAVLERRLGF